MHVCMHASACLGSSYVLPTFRTCECAQATAGHASSHNTGCAAGWSLLVVKVLEAPVSGVCAGSCHALHLHHNVVELLGDWQHLLQQPLLHGGPLLFQHRHNAALQAGTKVQHTRDTSGSASVNTHAGAASAVSSPVVSEPLTK